MTRLHGSCNVTAAYLKYMDTKTLTFLTLDEWRAACPLYLWRVEEGAKLPDNINGDGSKPALPMRQAADKIGISYQSVLLWEHGEFMPKYEYFIVMAKLFNYDSTDKLFTDWQAWRDAKPAVQPAAV